MVSESYWASVPSELERLLSLNGITTWHRVPVIHRTRGDRRVEIE